MGDVLAGKDPNQAINDRAEASLNARVANTPTPQPSPQPAQPAPEYKHPVNDGACAYISGAPAPTAPGFAISKWDGDCIDGLIAGAGHLIRYREDAFPGHTDAGLLEITDTQYHEGKQTTDNGSYYALKLQAALGHLGKAELQNGWIVWEGYAARPIEDGLTQYTGGSSRRDQVRDDLPIAIQENLNKFFEKSGRKDLMSTAEAPQKQPGQMAHHAPKPTTTRPTPPAASTSSAAPAAPSARPACTDQALSPYFNDINARAPKTYGICDSARVARKKFSDMLELVAHCPDTGPFGQLKIQLRNQMQAADTTAEQSCG